MWTLLVVAPKYDDGLYPRPPFVEVRGFRRRPPRALLFFIFFPLFFLLRGCEKRGTCSIFRGYEMGCKKCEMAIIFHLPSLIKTLLFK